jgi:hypothetical protein
VRTRVFAPKPKTPWHPSSLAHRIDTKKGQKAIPKMFMMIDRNFLPMKSSAPSQFLVFGWLGCRFLSVGGGCFALFALPPTRTHTNAKARIKKKGEKAFHAPADHHVKLEERMVV